MEHYIKPYLNTSPGPETESEIILFPDEIEREINHLFELDRTKERLISEDLEIIICQDPNDYLILLDMFDYLMDKYDPIN